MMSSLRPSGTRRKWEINHIVLATQSCPLFAVSWTVAPQAPPSMGFSRQEYWSGLPCPPPGYLPDPGANSGLLHCRWILYHLSHRLNMNVNKERPSAPAAVGWDPRGGRHRLSTEWERSSKIDTWRSSCPLWSGSAGAEAEGCYRRGGPRQACRVPSAGLESRFRNEPDSFLVVAFLATSHSIWGCGSWIRDWTSNSCIGSVES